MSRRKLVVGNWKMNGMRAHLDEVEAIGRVAAAHPAVEVGLCLPATLIMAGSERRGAAFIGAQNCHMDISGAYTGSLSAEMLLEAGASWVITGHSERREARGETNADIAAKSAAAHRVGIHSCPGGGARAHDDGPLRIGLNGQPAGARQGRGHPASHLVACRPHAERAGPGGKRAALPLD